MYKYPMNDMDSVYTHYDKDLHKNVQTPNVIVVASNNATATINFKEDKKDDTKNNVRL